MFSKCANSKCKAPFVHTEGQLLRFVKAGSNPEDRSHGVQHVWLCGNCCELYKLERTAGEGFAIVRSSVPRRQLDAYLVATT